MPCSRYLSSGARGLPRGKARKGVSVADGPSAQEKDHAEWEKYERETSVPPNLDAADADSSRGGFKVDDFSFNHAAAAGRSPPRPPQQQAAPAAPPLPPAATSVGFSSSSSSSHSQNSSVSKPPPPPKRRNGSPSTDRPPLAPVPPWQRNDTTEPRNVAPSSVQKPRAPPRPPPQQSSSNTIGPPPPPRQGSAPGSNPKARVYADTHAANTARSGSEDIGSTLESKADPNATDKVGSAAYMQEQVKAAMAQMKSGPTPEEFMRSMGLK